MKEKVKKLVSILLERSNSVRVAWDKLPKNSVSDDFFYDFSDISIDILIERLRDIESKLDSYDSKEMVVISNELLGISQRINYLGRYLTLKNIEVDFIKKMTQKH